ncbi:hypothetical protein CR51_12915 [Caballeronia megalochromosomata]|nr:hypothetical protein CR51_12915 [Caballeronia megalochromosomata]
MVVLLRVSKVHFMGLFALPATGSTFRNVHAVYVRALDLKSPRKDGSEPMCRIGGATTFASCRHDRQDAESCRHAQSCA